MLDEEQKRDLKLIRGLQDMAEETGVQMLVSKAPEEPEEKKTWAHHLMRIQVAMWVDGGAACAHCGHKYESVDDFLNRYPRVGKAFGNYNELSGWFVDSACFAAYMEGKG